MDLTASSRTLATLAILAVVFLGSVAWAWSQVTDPFPEKVKAAPCTDTMVAAGDDVRPPQVMVSVLNAGGRDGLAGETMEALVKHGFASGGKANAEAPEGRAGISAQIWTTEPDSAAVALVQSYLGPEVDVLDQTSGRPGITVVVGKRFASVVKGKRAVRAATDTWVCTPPLVAAPTD